MPILSVTVSIYYTSGQITFREKCTPLVGFVIEYAGVVCYYKTTMQDNSTRLQFDQENVSTRIIQEYVPGRQITIAHVIANPDRELCQRIGLEDVDAIGIMTITPGESAIIAGDLALKAADIEIGFLDRFSGTLVITGRLTSVETAIDTANQGLQKILKFFPAQITRT